MVHFCISTVTILLRGSTFVTGNSLLGLSHCQSFVLTHHIQYLQIDDEYMNGIVTNLPSLGHFPL